MYLECQPWGEELKKVSWDSKGALLIFKGTSCLINSKIEMFELNIYM